MLLSSTIYVRSNNLRTNFGCHCHAALVGFIIRFILLCLMRSAICMISNLSLYSIVSHIVTIGLKGALSFFCSILYH